MTTDLMAAYIIVLREGIEALLLIMLFNKASMNAENRKWVISGSLAGIAIPLAFATFFMVEAERSSDTISMLISLVAGSVLLYVFFWSRSIMSHVKEHVDQMTTYMPGPSVMLSCWFIVAREMTEVCLMLINNYRGDPNGTIAAIAAGAITLAAISTSFGWLLSRINIGTFFRYSSWAFGAMGLYYIFEATEKAIDMGWIPLL